MADRLFLVNLDLNNNKIKNFVVGDAGSDPTGVTGKVYYNTSSNVLKYYNGSAWVALSTGGGTVTSVGLSLPDIFTVSNSPVTGTGTLTGTLANQTANKVFASPNGSTGAPTFRALVATDIPDLSGTYLTSFTETDPVFVASDAYGITSTDITNWDTAYGWGNHASAGYLTSESDPVFTASDAFGITSTDITNWDTAYGWGNHASAGYLTTETDPVFTASDAFGITSTDITSWDTAYGWGNHASAGYLTSESDPVFTASDAFGITSTDISNWDAAYGWGNHASAGYLTSAVTAISNTDGNITFSSSTGSVTADLATNVEIDGDLTIGGDLNVTGAINSVSTTTINVEDNTFLLNSTVTGSPVADAGIQVERGTETNASLLWDESAGLWTIGLLGAEKQVARKYSTSINTTGGSAATVTHNLGTQDVVVQCFLSNSQIEADVDVTGSNTITVTTNSSETGIKVVVIG